MQRRRLRTPSHKPHDDQVVACLANGQSHGLIGRLVGEADSAQRRTSVGFTNLRGASGRFPTYVPVVTNGENDEAEEDSAGSEPGDENATEHELDAASGSGVAERRPPLPPEAYASFMRQVGGVTAFQEQMRHAIAPPD